jgi:hypothetical protein
MEGTTMLATGVFAWDRGRAYEFSSGSIRQVGRGRDVIHPLEVKKERPLYLQFAELDTPESCLNFAHAWGLLTLRAKDGAAERLGDWQKLIREMQAMISMVEVLHATNPRPIRMSITGLEVTLVSGAPGEPPSLQLQPTALWTAMLLELAQAQASGAELATCEQCGQRFEIGGDHGKRRYPTAVRFCSRECINRWTYENKTKPARASAA